jgi:hypothetical protein
LQKPSCADSAAQISTSRRSSVACFSDDGFFKILTATSDG